MNENEFTEIIAEETAAPEMLSMLDYILDQTPDLALVPEDDAVGIVISGYSIFQLADLIAKPNGETP